MNDFTGRSGVALVVGGTAGSAWPSPVSGQKLDVDGGYGA